MDRLQALPKEARADARRPATLEAGRAWLADQGARSGFRLPLHAAAETILRVDGYDHVRVARGRGRKAITFSVLDLEGMLEVASPDSFLEALVRGFGKAKAFGCGLMLIRRS
jgi:CRISPR system Cascade subunit CasE